MYDNPYRASEVLEPAADDEPSSTGDVVENQLPPAYRGAIRTSLWCLLSMFLLAALLLDGGQTLRRFIIIALAQWAVVLILIYFRQNRPHPMAVHFIAYGNLYLFCACIIYSSL